VEFEPWLITHLVGSEDIQRKTEPLEREVAQIKKRLQEIENEIRRFVKALGQGKLSIERLETEIGELEASKRLLEAQLDELHRKINDCAARDYKPKFAADPSGLQNCFCCPNRTRTIRGFAVCPQDRNCPPPKARP
jgi:chaperonin cofactor prefoldin